MIRCGQWAEEKTDIPATGGLTRLLREWKRPMGVREYDSVTASRERSCLGAIALCGRSDRTE